ncbi:putative WD repeat-containing protein C2A9.03 [Glycine max]|nr:putative WD repeat-containing protein C2A9.03 [Glycine max]
MAGSNSSSSTSNNMEGNCSSYSSDEEDLTMGSEGSEEVEGSEGESEEGLMEENKEESEGESQEGRTEDDSKEESEVDSEEEEIFSNNDEHIIEHVSANMSMLDGETGGESESKDDDTLRSGIDTKIITAQEARDLNDVQGIKWAAEKKDRTDFRRARLRRMGAKHITLMPTLVWSTSKHDVYMAGNFKIIHWSGLSSKMTDVLDTAEHVTSSEDYPGNYEIGFHQSQINTVSVRFNLLIVGGNFGQLICKRIDRPDVSFCYKMSCRSGSIQFMHSSLNPRDQQTLLVVGDNAKGRLVNCIDGEAIATLSGHSDMLYASAWHPDGYKFATGSVDKTCRIWDIRKTSESMDVLKGNAEAIRSLCFTADGQYMAMGETVDFVHIYDASRFEKKQVVDFFRTGLWSIF